MGKTRLPIADFLFEGLDNESRASLQKALGQERQPKATHKYLRREKNTKTGKWDYIYKVEATGKEVKSEEGPSYWKDMPAREQEMRKIAKKWDKDEKEGGRVSPTYPHETTKEKPAGLGKEKYAKHVSKKQPMNDIQEQAMVDAKTHFALKNYEIKDIDDKGTATGTVETQSGQKVKITMDKLGHYKIGHTVK